LFVILRKPVNTSYRISGIEFVFGMGAEARIVDSHFLLILPFSIRYQKGPAPSKFINPIIK